MTAMLLKVLGGTPSGTPLCRTCVNAHYFRGRSQTEVTLVCGALWQFRELEFEAYECSEYDRDETDLDDMRKTAWTLSTKKRGKVGFTPPKNEEKSEQ